MNQLAYDISSSQALTARLELVVNNVNLEIPSKKIITLGLILGALQVLDGILTGIGVHIFGTAVEANNILRFFMEILGPYTALFIFKFSALFIITALCFSAHQVKWLPNAFKAIIAYYVCLAIIPWAYILLSSANIL